MVEAALKTRAPVRIGELSRRVGVNPGTLRAWERRYGILSPLRTESGYRLYTAEDEARIRQLTRLRAQGVATAEAARLAREFPHLAIETGKGAAEHAAPSQVGARVAGRAASSEEDVGAPAPTSLRDPVSEERMTRLAAVLDRFDNYAANAEIDRAIAELPLTELIEGVIMPVLRGLGERWKQGEVTPAQEHFASNLIRGRLMNMSRGRELPTGSLALLACASGEQHDIGLLSFGLLLRERGWRIVFIGQDTPAANVAEAASTLAPDAVVLAGVEPRRLRDAASELKVIAGTFDLYIGGRAASRRFAARIGATHLEGELSYAAEVLDRRFAPLAA